MNRKIALIVVTVVAILIVFGISLIAIALAEAVKPDKLRKFRCIEDFMYMKVEGTLLPYPNSIDHQTCIVFKYRLENESK